MPPPDQHGKKAVINLGDPDARLIVTRSLPENARLLARGELPLCWPDLLAALREWQKPCTSDLDSANLGRVRHRILEQNAERERRELAQIKR